MASLGEGGGLADMVSAVGMNTLSVVQEHLVAEGAKGEELPMLAEKLEMSPDGRTVTFKLRRGVQWHDGWGEFTSADVRFTIEQMMGQAASKATLAPWFREKVETIETPDAYTLIIRVKPGQETFDFFTQIDNHPPHLTIASKKYVEAVGREEASKKWIGTGPWKFVELKKGDYAKFEAVENHWRKTPEFKYLILREVPEAATQKLMLQAGDVDVISVSLDAIAEVEKSGFKVLSSPGHPFFIGFGGLYLPTREGFDPSLPWVANPADSAAWEKALKVRKALNMAVDKEKIFNTILGGRGLLSAVPAMLPIHPGYDPSWKQYPYDPEAARKLLAEAGYAKGFPVTVRLFPMPGREVLPDIGQAVGMYLQQIGLNVTLETIDYTGVMSPDQRGRKLKSLYTFGIYYPEAVSAWRVLSHSKSGTMWLAEHPWLDDMITKGLAEMDATKRAAIQRQIGQWLIDNAIAIPIASSTVNYAINPKKIKDWPLVPAQAWPINTEYITRAQ